MCKKLLYLIVCTVLVNSVSAADIWWDNGDINDNLWSSPDNWVGNVAPSSNDHVIVTGTSTATSALIETGVAATGRWIMAQAANTAYLTMTGGTLTSLPGGALRLGYETLKGRFNLSGGTVTVNDCMYVGYGTGGNGDGTLNMSGGSVSIAWNLDVPGSTGKGTANLDGGTISVGNTFNMNSNGLVDITDGTLIINGDKTTDVNNYVSNGWITAFGSLGEVKCDYNITNTSKTTVTAIAPSAGIPALEAITFDFEAATEPDDYWRNSTYTSITTATSEVISGNKSLKFDTMSYTGDFIDLFRSITPDVNLVKGSRYSIDFDYKVLDINKNNNSHFFSRVHSDDNRFIDWEYGFKDWLMSADPNHHKILHITQQDDARVFFGNYRQSQLVLDNIMITKLPDVNVAAQGQVVSDNNYEPYGMAENLCSLGYSDADVLTCINMFASAGIQWHRTGVWWLALEPGFKGNIYAQQVQRQDMVIDTLISRGIKFYINLGGQPKWASSEPDESDYWTYPPADMNDWTDHVAFMANRYKDKVTHWEVYNEIDYTFWRGTIEEYADYLEAAYDKLKEIDPNNKVIMSPLGYDGVDAWRPYMPGIEEHALQRLYDAGVKEHFDIAAIHPYTWRVDPGTIISIDIINTFYNVMKNNGDGDKPIWITEVGEGTWSWGQSVDPCDATAQSLEDQADYIESVYTELIKHPKIEKIFWYNFRCTTSGDGNEDNFGLTYPDLGIRPAYTRLMNLPKSSVRKVNYDYVPDYLLCDLDGSNIIDYNDINILSSNWLASDCNFPGWCEGADINHDGSVNFIDFTKLAEYWSEDY